MLAITIIALACLSVLAAILSAAQALTRKTNMRSTNILYTVLYVMLLFAAVSIVILYLN